MLSPGRVNNVWNVIDGRDYSQSASVAPDKPNLFGIRRYTVTSVLAGWASNPSVGDRGESKRQNLASPCPLRCSTRTATAVARSNVSPPSGSLQGSDLGREAHARTLCHRFAS